MRTQHLSMANFTELPSISPDHLMRL